MSSQKNNTVVIDEKINRREMAMANFYAGYNCTQSVVLAFADLIDIDTDILLKMVSGFGGGMGRLREVCGCVSGMFFVLSYFNGYSDPKAVDDKTRLYKEVQELAKRFEEKNGSIVCRELLGLDTKRQEPIPEERTKEYYEKRPCPALAGMAAEILENFLKDEEI